MHDLDQLPELLSKWRDLVNLHLKDFGDMSSALPDATRHLMIGLEDRTRQALERIWPHLYAPGNPETRLYVILRDSMSGGALLSYDAHGAREARGPRPSKGENVTILVASRQKMDTCAQAMKEKGWSYSSFVETEGKMKGCITSLSFAVTEPERAELPEVVRKLPLWSEKASAAAAAE